MKYYRQNVLVIEYPTSFLGHPTTARINWAVAWTELSSDNKVKFIEKGSKFDAKGRKHTRNMVLIDLHCNRETFIDEISRFFSQKLDVNIHDLKFRFKKYQPFGDLNVKP